MAKTSLVSLRMINYDDPGSLLQDKLPQTEGIVQATKQIRRHGLDCMLDEFCQSGVGLH